MLVRHMPTGFRPVTPAQAAAIQAAMPGPALEPDWLFQQCHRIAAALADGEVALAQIYGLRIPVGELDGTALRRIAAAARVAKANFNPDEPRLPQGGPGGGEWTDGTGSVKPSRDARHPASGSGAGPTEPKPSAGGDGSENGSGDRPPMEYRLPIPAERPATAKERYRVVRRTAEWLRGAAALGAAFAPEPRVRAVLLAIEGTAWLVEYLPEIRSYYLDGPKSLQELQDAVDDPQPGYENHHIVERQAGSQRQDSNAQRFGTRLDSRENLVRIPKWRHVEISSWYSTGNEEYRGLTPRAYLRGKSWDEQYTVGLSALRLVGVLK